MAAINHVIGLPRRGATRERSPSARARRCGHGTALHGAGVLIRVPVPHLRRHLPRVRPLLPRGAGRGVHLAHAYVPALHSARVANLPTPSSRVLRTGRIIATSTTAVLVVHGLLVVMEPQLPFTAVATGAAAHLAYFWLLGSFPALNVASPPFLTSLVMLALSHYMWGSYFLSHYHQAAHAPCHPPPRLLSQRARPSAPGDARALLLSLQRVARPIRLLRLPLRLRGHAPRPDGGQCQRSVLRGRAYTPPIGCRLGLLLPPAAARRHDAVDDEKGLRRRALTARRSRRTALPADPRRSL